MQPSTMTLYALAKSFIMCVCSLWFLLMECKFYNQKSILWRNNLNSTATYINNSEQWITVCLPLQKPTTICIIIQLHFQNTSVDECSLSNMLTGFSYEPHELLFFTVKTFSVTYVEWSAMRDENLYILSLFFAFFVLFHNELDN